VAGFWRRWIDRRRGESHDELRHRYQRFQHLIEKNNRVLDLIADAGEKSGGDHLFDRHYVDRLAEELEVAVSSVVYDLNVMSGNRYGDLVAAFERICQSVHNTLSPAGGGETELTLALESVDRDYAVLVGEKLAQLGEVRHRLGIAVPEGFVASAAACRRQFLAAGIDRLLEARAGDLGASNPRRAAAAADLQAAVRRARLDGSVARALRREARRASRAGWRYAVRSSAVGEGGEHSFAGLHATVLNVAPRDLADAYREVLASLFSPEALGYRLENGLPVAGALMPVGFLAMVPARSSGVIHTVKATNPQLDVMTVTAVWGLGPSVVQGSEAADAFELSRDPTPRILSRQIADKARALRARAESGTALIPVAEAERRVPSVSDAELVRLGRLALRIERHAGQHQEIEWAIDGAGELVVLQARVLRVAPFALRDGVELAQLLARRHALVRGSGVIACGGVGAGPVAVVRSPEELETFPAGGVLVTQAPAPQFAALLGRAAAVITEVGSATGHLATVAREYRVPMIVGVAEATDLLTPGAEITVDAEENVIYEGVIHELLRHHLSRLHGDTDFEEFRLLRRLLRRVAPLNLTDPAAENFRASGCATCHDVVRFAHEMAVRELVNMPGLTMRDRRRFVRRLHLPIPLDLDVLDLGGGIAPGQDGSTVEPEGIASLPLTALLGDLCASWRTDPVAMDVGSFLSSATRGTTLSVTDASQVRPNLAVIARDYLNLHLLLGYHFNMVDCRMTETDAANYVYFRFHGGVTEITRRSRRARTIAAILATHGFGVETKGDLVVGRLRDVPMTAMRETLAMIGRLIGYTRQLDVLMRDEGSVQEFTRDFCERRPVPGGAPS
jgi:pyruvate,water dikinase